MTLNSTTLRNGRLILVAFDDTGPCAWLSGYGVDVEGWR